MIELLNWAARSDLESKRFLAEIYRSTPEIVPPMPHRALLAAGVDVLVLRVRAGEHQIPRSFVSDDYEVLYADSLVYYSMTLPAKSKQSIVAIEPPFSIRRATATDADDVAHLAASSFSNYPSHYAASPDIFTSSAVALGYAQWASDHVRNMDNGRSAFVALRDSQVIGFLTYAINEAGHSMEIILNAVAASERRLGIYSGLLHRAIDHAARAGCQEIRVSTQLANIPVQRAWTRLGLGLSSALDTYHVRRRVSKQSNENLP